MTPHYFGFGYVRYPIHRALAAWFARPWQWAQSDAALDRSNDTQDHPPRTKRRGSVTPPRTAKRKH